MTNANCPPLQIEVLSSFIQNESASPTVPGTLISVRALMNQALQFSVLLETGALYTGLPVNALASIGITPTLELGLAQAYDCIGSSIEIVQFDVLRYMLCTVKDFKGRIYKGKYLFTIDFTDNNGLARHPEQWKQFHVVCTNSGWMIYPQYRIIFQDDAFCPRRHSRFSYKYNTKTHLAEDWSSEMLSAPHAADIGDSPTILRPTNATAAGDKW